MDTSNYLSIGDFARLSGIKRKTLIYYDQIGLLAPVHTTEKGYRYYDYPQLYKVNMINLFKEIKMPLAEIKDHLQNSTPEKAAILLKRQRELIRQKQEYYEQMAGMVDRQLSSLEEYATADRLKFSIVHLEQQPLFFSSTAYQVSTFRASIPLSDIYQQSFAAGYEFIYPSGFMFENTSSLLDADVLYAANVHPYIKVPEAAEARPAGDYLICYFHGETYRAIVFQQMIDYIKQHHLIIQGDIYIDVILNGLSAQKFDDFLLKLIVQVRPK